VNRLDRRTAGKVRLNPPIPSVRWAPEGLEAELTVLRGEF